jgi:hypothetical protein
MEINSLRVYVEERDKKLSEIEFELSQKEMGENIQTKHMV